MKTHDIAEKMNNRRFLEAAKSAMAPRTGERISTIRHLFNLREGLNPLQLKVPDRVLGKPSQKEGPLAGVTIDEDTLVKEYLRVLDWDMVTTRPSSKRLTELGLTDIAKLVKV